MRIWHFGGKRDNSCKPWNCVWQSKISAGIRGVEKLHSKRLNTEVPVCPEQRIHFKWSTLFCLGAECLYGFSKCASRAAWHTSDGSTPEGQGWKMRLFLLKMNPQKSITMCKFIQEMWSSDLRRSTIEKTKIKKNFGATCIAGSVSSEYPMS